MCHCIGDPSLRQAKSWLPLSALFNIMEFLSVLLAIGFGIHYTYRHPAKPFKVVGSGLTLIGLGVLGCGLFLFLVLGILTALS